MCQTCDERKSLADFHIDHSSPLGRKTSCRSCRTKVESARHYKDRERITQRMRDYRAQNLEAARARGAASYRRNKDKNIAAAIAGAHVSSGANARAAVRARHHCAGPAEARR